MDIDTDINNYKLSDMTKLFNVSNKLTHEEINEINEIMNKSNSLMSGNSTITPSIYNLFKKVSIILRCLNKYRDYLKIKNNDYQLRKEDDYKLIFFIKNIKNFEDTSDINELLNKLIKNEDVEINPIINDETHQIVLDNIYTKIYNTFENKVVSGNINPIKRITNLVNVHINSCFRDKYYNSNPCNFMYNLPKQLKNVISMKLASIEIPNSWYMFSHLKKNNIFVIEITVCDECSIHNIIIPDGNYTNDSLTAFLNSKYFYQSDTDSPTKFIKFYINEHTNRSQFEIAEGTPNDFVFSIHFTNKDTDNILETAGWTLGYRLARYLKIEDFIISEGLFDGGGDRYIYLTVNEYQYNYNETNIICFDKSCVEDYTLAKIPLINGKLSMIIDENNKNPLVKIRQYNGPININKLEIKILDKFGNVIDLNFMDFSLSLELEILYDRNNII